MPLPLHEIFPDEDYRFHLTLRKGDVGDFFGANDPAVVAERVRWLEAEPARYAGCLAAAAPAVREFAAWMQARGVVRWADGLTAEALNAALGRTLAADFLLLRESATGEFKLEAGVVCFPSSWDPAEKFGHGLEAIHGVVPRLNPTMGATIGLFLKKLRPGAAFERANWGLAATTERNMHPSRGCPRLTAHTPLDKIWVRIEDQLLAALPETGAILFGIALRIVPLAEVIAEPALRVGLTRALRTMPDDVAGYKGLATVRGPLLAALG